MIYKDIRNTLLKEAQSSPNLLSDLAGLECYISESYHNRSFVELLQNADDAGATRFAIIKNGDYLYVANNGRVFSENDFESLCRSASSKKVKGSTIGYRGIGFKSVVGFSKEIFLFSGELEVVFSKERTKNDIPSALRVPLIRIPHELTMMDKTPVENDIARFKNDGYTTVFVFRGVDLSVIESEFECFEYNSLLFLRNIKETYIRFNEPRLTVIDRANNKESLSKVTLKTADDVSTWLVSNYAETSLVFNISGGVVTKLPPDKSLVHAFLPTEDLNGMGVLINGNFSTDPSRRHIIYDDETLSTLQNCCRNIIYLMKLCLQNCNRNSIGIVNSLIPTIDVQLAQLSKNSFIKYLLSIIQNVDNKYFEALFLCPKWLNVRDFTNMTDGRFNVIDSDFYVIDGLRKYLRYLGSNELKEHDMLELINGSNISVYGCMQLVKQIFSSFNSLYSIDNDVLCNLKLFYSCGKRVSIEDLRISEAAIDESFLTLLAENGFGESEIKQMYKRYLPWCCEEKQGKMFVYSTNEVEKSSGNNEELIRNDKSVAGAFVKQSLSQKVIVKQWRCAEELTMEILNQKGFNLKDVSKQNIGYDLEGTDQYGKEALIEVKAVAYIGQKIRFTNNEVAVAQEKRKSYYAAIVRQIDNFFEIAMVQDPINNLTLNRQCVQWVWECESYEYKPVRFEI